MNDTVFFDKAFILFEQKKFDEVFSLVQSENFGKDQLLIFYKRQSVKKPGFLQEPSYWQSNLPHLHLNAILKSDFWITFLSVYFSAATFCNHKLNDHLYFLDPEAFIGLWKLWDVGRHEAFLNSIEELALKHSQLATLHKESKLIRKAKDRNLIEKNNCIAQFQKSSFERVILAFVLYYEGFKNSPAILGDRAKQVSVETALVSELNNYLKLTLLEKGIQFSGNENKLLQLKLENLYLILFSDTYIHFNPEKEFYFSLFEWVEMSMNISDKKNMIRLYQADQVNMLPANLNSIPIQTNANHSLFRINELKSTCEEFYISDISLIEHKFNSAASINKARADISGLLKWVDFYSVPIEIQYRNNSICIKKLFQLLKEFSVYKGPVEFAEANLTPPEFKHHFGGNESMTIWGESELKVHLCTYYKWERLEIEQMLDLLTTDLNKPINSKTWLERPFLKINDQILWLGIFLRDRRWDNILINRIKSDPDLQKAAQQMASGFEKKIGMLFQSNGYQVIAEKFKLSDGQSGDIDMLAYKDNTLFICEAKTSRRSDDFVHAADFEIERLHGKASFQITKSVKYIEENWPKVKRSLQLDEAISLKDVSLVPLLVSDVFDGDQKRYDGIRKTTLLELDVMLKNQKKHLIEPYLHIQRFTNSMNRNYQEPDIDKISWDLWGGKESCTAQTLIDGLDNNLIWNELEKLAKFDPVTYQLDY